MKKFSLLVISFILCCTNVVWADWSLSYKLGADGAWTHNVAPQGDGYVHIDLAANSTYYIYTLIDGNGYASGDATMTFSNSSKFELTSYGEATYTGLKIKTTQAAEYKFTLSYFDEKQHISAVYPAAVYLPGSWNEWTIAEDVKFDANNMFVLHLAAGTYTFKAVNNDGWHGNGGTMDGPKQGWNFDADKDCTLKIATEDDYTFTYSWNNSHPMINVFSSTDVAKSATTGNPNPVMDGITTGGSRWESIQNDDQWWLAKFPEAQMFDNVTITWEGAYGKTYNILGSNNGTEWTTIKEVDEELSGFPHVQSLDLASVATYQYVKFQGIKRGTGYGYSFWEFALKYNNIPVPTNVAVSATGRITFDYEDEADSFEARIYKNNVLIHSQVVENNDVFNFIPTETGTCQVKVVAKVGENTSKESVAYDWSVEAYHVYGKSAYCDYLWETTQNGGWPIYMSWVTDKNGNVTITIEPKGDEGDGITAFRSAEINKFKVGGAAASTYFNVSYSGNVMTLTLIDPTNRPVNGTIISHDGSFCYKTGTHTNAWPNLKLDYAYGTKCVASDAVNPVITTFEKASADLTSITFNVEASDEDDEGVENDVTYKVSGVPGITEQTVTLTDGQFTLTNLTPGVEYTFTLTATDPSGNYSTANVVSTTAFYPPTNIQISVMGRVSFTAATDATSYEARIYDGEDLVGTQVVAIGDMLNFISKESNYDVRLISKKDSYQSLESENYVWNAGANKVYGISNYVVSNQKTDKNEGHNADVFFTWETLKNGDVQISITNAQGEIDADYHFRGDGMNATKFNLNGSAEDFANTFTCDHTSGSAIYTLHLTGATPALGSIISYSGDNVTYSVPGATNAWPNTTFSYTYGTPRYPIETTNPIIASFTGESNDYTTAELTISASDLDDDNLPQTILTYTLSADNDFVTTQVVPDAQGKVLLEGLKKNAIYHFHIVVSDPSGNTDEEDVEVKMKWDDTNNLALNKPCTGGFCQFNSGTPEGRAGEYKKANDGKTDVKYSAYGAPENEAWWQVDLGYVFTLSRIDVTWTNDYSNNYQILGSYDGEDWFEMATDAATAEGLKSTTLNAAARYVKVFSVKRNVVFAEVEIYGSGWGATDTTNPVISTFTITPVDATSVTLHVEATDVDDEDNPQPLTYKVNGNNDFVEQAIVLDGDNNVTLTDLKKNCDYTFTVTAIDPVTNSTTSDPVDVRMIFDPTYNLALDGLATAGYSQNSTSVASKANDGDASTKWNTYGVNDSEGGYANNWWQVELKTIYDISRIVANYQDATNNIFVFEGSCDGENWFHLCDGKNTTNGVQEYLVSAPAQYIRYSCSNRYNAVYEFEVYGTGYSTTDNVAPEVAVSEISKTTNSVTLQIDATDEDDNGVSHPVKSIRISGNNGFTTIENAVLDANNQIVLDGLKENTSYQFKVLVTDRVGLIVEDSINVRVVFDPTNNLALNKPCEAGINQGANVASHANDGKEDNFWTCFGTGTSDQWWWKVDLGASFNVNRVRILFNDHSGTYNLLSSEDGESWNNYATNFTIDNDHVDYSINVVTSTRYFKFTSTAANVGIKEFEVYGTGYNDGDEEAPIITAASLVGEAEENTATISVTATDNVGVYSCRFVDATNAYDQTYEYVAGKNITVTGLVPSTTYNFTITASDRAENVSEGFVMTAFTTKANDNVPHVAAPAPQHSQLEVISIYSDKFTSAVKTPFSWTSWGGATIKTEGNIGGNNYVHYVFGGHGEIGIGDKFKDVTTNEEGINVSTKKNLHINIWSLTNDQINITLNDQTVASNLQLVAGEWISFEIDLTAFAASHSDILTALKWMKFTACQNKTIAVDNIYFYTEVTDITLEQTADNSTIISAYNGLTRNVTINRPFTAGTVYTLCLPFDANEDQCVEALGAGYKLEKLGEAYMKSSDMMYLPFSQVASIEAGVPYLFTPAVTHETLTFEGVVIDKDTKEPIGNSLCSMTGFVNPTVIPTNVAYYLGNDQYLHLNTGTGATYAFRAYFNLNFPAGSPVSARARIAVTDKPTDLDEQSAINNQQSKMLIDGQLIIIRDGKMYDAQGQLVK